MNKHKKIKPRASGRMILGIVGAVLVMGTAGNALITSMVPVNGSYPVFGAATNYYLKSIKSPDKGYVFASQSVKGGKTVPLLGARSPSLLAREGNLVTIHIINEDRSEHGVQTKHNIHIDEFNVHSKDLDYFQTQSITFLADKKGTFDYYCSLHPEMNGKLIVE